jgi:hypothetical protein
MMMTHIQSGSRWRGWYQLTAMLVAGVLACVASAANAGCTAGDAIQVVATSKATTAKTKNQSNASLQDLVQQDAMKCVNNIMQLISNTAIKAADISSSLMQQVIDQLATTACNIVQTEVKEALSPVTTFDNDITASVNNINSSIKASTGINANVLQSSSTSVGKATGTTGLSNSASGTTSSSTWGKATCTLFGTC